MKLVILLLVIGGAAGEVVVYKCCPEEHQFREGKCLEGGPKEWAPVVYSPTTRGFLAPGTTPLDWKFVVSKPDTCSKPHFYETEPGSLSPYVVFENGSLFHQDDHNNLVHPGGFCIDSAGALACLRADPEGPLEPASTSVSVRKCCGPGAAYSETNESCVAVEGERHRFGSFDVHSGFPVCPEAGSYAIGGKLNSTHWLHDDGTLRGGERRLNGEQFCLERIVEHPEEPLHVFTCPGSHIPAGDPRFTLYPVGLFLSVFFLVITLIASCLLPSTYHVLHWRCQTNHVACLLIGDLLLAITQLSGDAIKGPACISVGESDSISLSDRSPVTRLTVTLS
jgi:G protein-coupled receptor Mth (Methuselah protein)